MQNDVPCGWMQTNFRIVVPSYSVPSAVLWLKFPPFTGNKRRQQLQAVLHVCCDFIHISHSSTLSFCRFFSFLWRTPIIANRLPAKSSQIDQTYKLQFMCWKGRIKGVNTSICSLGAVSAAVLSNSSGRKHDCVLDWWLHIDLWGVF